MRLAIENHVMGRGNGAPFMAALWLKMKIELFKKKDFSGIVELLLSADPDIACVNRYINKGEILTAIIYDEVVGVAVVVIHGEEAELKNIAVRPMEQGKGIAKDLIEEVKKLSQRLGATLLIVGTGNSSLSQLALYQKCGFQFYQVIPNFFEAFVQRSHLVQRLNPYLK